MPSQRLLTSLSGKTQLDRVNVEGHQLFEEEENESKITAELEAQDARVKC